MGNKSNLKSSVRILAIILIALFVGTAFAGLFSIQRKGTVENLADVETEEDIKFEDPVELTVGLKWDNGEISSDEVVVSAASDEFDTPSSAGERNFRGIENFSFKKNGAVVEDANGDAYTISNVGTYFSEGAGKNALKNGMKLKLINTKMTNFSNKTLTVQTGAVLILNSSKTETLYSMNFNMKMGWCLVGFQAGYTNNGFQAVGGESQHGVENCRAGLTSGETSSEADLQTLDPNYSGTIQVKIWVARIKYEVDLYYVAKENGSLVQKIKTIEYTNEEGYVLFPESNPGGDIDGYEFKGWAFKTRAASNQNDAVVLAHYVKDTSETKDAFWNYYTNGQEIKVVAKDTTTKENGKQIKFKSSSDTGTWTTGTGAPYTYYDVSGVKGYGELSQDSDNGGYGPIIEAIYKRLSSEQAITIDNSGQYWKDYPETDKKEQLYGAFSLEEKGAITTRDNTFEKTNLKVNKSDEDYKFYETSYKAFKQHGGSGENYLSQTSKDLETPNQDTKRGYYIYNFGHYVSGYKIKVGTGWLDIEGSGFKKVSSETTISLAKLKSKSLTLASVVDFVDRTTSILENLPSITIYPVWEKVEITIKNNSIDIRNIEFGDTYKGSDGNTAVPAVSSEGKTAYARIVDNEYIALDGVWNYANVLANRYTMIIGESFSGETHTPAKFYFEVSGAGTAEVSNIYRLNLLLAPKTNESNKYTYKITGTGKTFASKPSEISADMLSYKNDFNGEYVGCSQYSEVASTYPFIDSYINYLKGCVETFTSKIDDTAEDNFKLFNNVYYASGTKSENALTLETTEQIIPWIYLAHDYKYSNLVSFIDDYEQTVIWGSETAIAYNTDYTAQFENELSGYIDHSDKWLYDGENNLYSHNANSVYLYYDYLNSSTSSNWDSVKAGLFAPNTSLDLTQFAPPTDSQTSGTLTRTFDKWYFDVDQAREDNYTVNIDTANEKLNVTGNSVNLTFIYTTKSQENNYYYLQSVQGYGAFIQNDAAPIIKAKWANSYNVEINNSGVYDEENFPVYWQQLFKCGEALSTSSLYGAYYGKDEEIISAQNAKIVNFTINKTSQLGIYSGAGHAFIKEDGTGSSEEFAMTYNSKFYRVFNYGHEVESWGIVITGEGIETTWISYLGGFSTSATLTKNSMLKLSTLKLAHIATYLDELFFNSTKPIKITFIPEWKNVSFTATYKDGSEKESSEEIYYSKNYEFDTSSFAEPIGKSLFAFKFSSEDLISLNGVWNYTKNERAYEYDSDTGLYTLEISSVYVDNIYKVELKDVYKNSRQSKNITLDTTKSQFVFATTENANEYSSIKYTYLTYPGSNYKFVGYSSYSGVKDLIECYTIYATSHHGQTGLKEHLENWKTSIANSALDMFGKIYYTNSDASSTGQNILIQNENNGSLCSNVTMWIYLANKQQYLNLPIFTNDNSKTIAWKTTQEYNQSNTYAYATQALADVESVGTKFLSQITQNGNSLAWQVNKSVNTEPSSEISLYSASAFKADLYYEDSNASNGVYSTEKSDWYLLDKHDELYSIMLGVSFADQVPKQELIVKNKMFDKWIFDRTAAETLYSVSESEDSEDIENGNGTLILTHADGNIVLKVAGFVQHHERTQDYAGVYYITEIGGLGIFEQNKDYPILLAKLKSIYDVTLDNSKTLQYSNNDYIQTWSAYNDTALKTKEDRKYLYGAVAYTVDSPIADIKEIINEENKTVYPDETLDFAKLTFKVADTDYYEYKYMTSITNNASTVFYHFEDMQGIETETVDQLPHSRYGYYYVYNYGYYISGWQIYLATSQKYLTLENKVWSSTATASHISINELDNVTFENFAEQIDCYNVLHSNRAIEKVTIVPIWSPVDIKVDLKAPQDGEELLVSNGNVGDREFTIKFGSYYKFDTNVVYQVTGKSLMAVYYDGEIDSPNMNSLIAIPLTENGSLAQIKWNYKDIPSGNYVVSENLSTLNYGDIVYTLSVRPLYVDNIYKVELKNVIPKSDGVYELVTSDYTVNDSTGNFNGDTNVNKYTYLSDIDSYTFSYYSDGNYVLTDDYIDVLNSTHTSYTNGVAGTFSLYNKVYYNSGWEKDGTTIKKAEGGNTGANFHIYLGNNQVMSKLPMFDNEYAKTVAWRSTEDYGASHTYAYATDGWQEDIGELDKFAEQIVDKKDQMLDVGSVWHVSNSWSAEQEVPVVWFSTSVYRLDLYYEDADNSNGIYSILKNDWYLLYHLDQLYSVETDNSLRAHQIPKEENLPDKKTFDEWIFNYDMMINSTNENEDNVYNYQVDNDKTQVDANGSGRIVINHANGTLILDTTGYVKYHTPTDTGNGIVYYVKAIGGEGIFVQDPDYPILVAKLSTIYDVTLDNSGSRAWSGFDESHNTESLYGAKAYTVANVVNDINKINEQANETTINSFCSVTFLVANTDAYKYKFMTSMVGNQSLVFHHLDDMEKIHPSNLPNSDYGYYYVYNYGHYISGWQIILPHSGKYLTRSNGVWGTTATPGTTIEIDQLIGATFATFAEFAEEADDYYATDPGRKPITIKPDWTAVDVCVQTNEITGEKDLFNNSTIKFGESYEFMSNVATDQSGKKLMAYYYDEESEGTSLIAKGGIWNYSNIAFDWYSPSHGEIIGNGTYTLSVIPIFVDNIYKVNLDNISPNMEGNYELVNTDFTYNSRSGNYYTTNDYYVLTFENSYKYNQGTYKFEYHSNSYSFMDDYILKLNEWLTTYRNGIDGEDEDDFDIFKKVYYREGEITADSLTLIPEGKNVSLNIYLANEQITGALPVFENPYYLLIFWENTENDEDGQQFAYSTNAYDPTEIDHVTEINEFATHKDADEFTNMWYFSDGDITTTPETFKAHYYRKSYFVTINTKVLEAIERRGYVLLDVQDKLYELDKNVIDRSGKYLIISEQIYGQYNMKVYELRREIDLAQFKIKDLDELAYRILPEPIIRVYIGCDVEMFIADQSKDPISMETGNFDEMIGYRYQELTQVAKEPAPSEVEEQPLFDSYDPTSPKYSYLATADEVVSKNYKNKTQVLIDIFYTQIKYDLDVYIQYLESGGFTVQKNSLGFTPVERNTSDAPYRLQDLILTDRIDITYYSYAGFTFEENKAFQFYFDSKKSHVLQTYVDAEADGRGYNQTYSFIITGRWLRINYYSPYQSSYPIWPSGENNPTDLGDIAINTKAITFNYGVKLRDYVDEDDLTNEKTIFDDANHNTTFALNIDTGENTTESIRGYLTRYSSICPQMLIYEYDYLSEDDTPLTSYKTILTSRMFFANIKDHDSTEDNHYTRYEFPIITLSQGAIDGFVLKPNHLAQMVNNYMDGAIVNSSDRNVYILLDTSTVKEVTLVQYANNVGHDSFEYSHDPMLSNKSVEIILEHNNQNISGNEINGVMYPFVATINSNSDYQTTDGHQLMSSISPWSTTQGFEYSFLTYIGMKVNFETKYNEKHYLSANISSVDMINGDQKVLTEWTNSNQITASYVDGFEVKWEPKPLNVEYVYQLNGETTTLETINEYIKENESYKQSTEKDLFMCPSCDAVTYEVTCVDSSYNIELSINDEMLGQTTSSIRTLSLIGENAYTISGRDYNLGKVQIKVNLVEKSSGNLSVGFRLKDNIFGGESFGTYDVSVNGVTLISGANERVVLAVKQDAQIKVKLNLSTGYRFTSYQHNNLNPVSLSLDGNNEFVMVSSYDIGYHELNGTNYYIDLEKVIVVASINKGQAVAKYFINGSEDSTQVYLGSGLNFTTIQDKSERLKHYYYVDKQGKSIYLTNDGTETGMPLTTLTITSELLDLSAIYDNETHKYNLAFYVVHVNKYQFNVSVESGEKFLKSEYPLILENVNAVASGTFFDEGTVLELRAETLLEDKYDIAISVNSSEYEAFTNCMKFTMTEDTNVILKVTPKIFSVRVKEYYLTTLNQVENRFDQSELTSEQVNNLGYMSGNSQAYDGTAKITFVSDIKGDRRLSSIIITHDDNSTQEIELDEYFDTTGTLEVAKLNSYLMTIGLGNYKFEFVSVDQERTTMSLTYVTKGNVVIDMYYKQYKIIDA